MIQMLTSVIGQRGVDAMAFLLAFALTALTDSIFRDKLPHDHGRAFAVNGELSKGKARGSGLIFVLCIALAEQYAAKGSVLAVSDAGCAAVLCKAALQAASLNVFINTKLMADRTRAAALDARADALLAEFVPRADETFTAVSGKLCNK